MSDFIDSERLLREMARQGLSRKQVAERLGIVPRRFTDIAISQINRTPVGFRARLEAALGLPDGSLKL